VPPTKVAVLGTLAEFHREPIPYDLRELIRLVMDLRPDLLCLDITPDQWQRRDFGDLPPEYRDALLRPHLHSVLGDFTDPRSRHFTVAIARQPPYNHIKWLKRCFAMNRVRGRPTELPR